MELRAGDIIATGTPSGVGMGMKPQRFLRAGDVIELTVQGLGRKPKPPKPQNKYENGAGGCASPVCFGVYVLIAPR